MKGTVHIFEFLDSAKAEVFGPVCALFGSERFLQKLACTAIQNRSGGDDSDFAISRFEGTAEWSEISDALSTRSLFASGEKQMVIVDNADPFVKQHRDKLEKRIADDNSSVLILVVESWASNTKLYKQIDKNGIQIHCDAPINKKGRSKKRDDGRIIKWLIARAKKEYDFTLNNAAATVVTELTECNFGRMDQELGKLCLYADETDLTPLEVRKIVGGWPAQTMWSAIDSALDGRAGQAIDLLKQLFDAGEHPLAMFGQISWSLRRFAEVGELVARDSRNGRRINLNDSLKAAGFRPWGNEMDAAAARLKQLGRKRVAQILDHIVAADFALKRSHSKEDRGRLLLELLFTRMSEQLSPANTTR
jgi:DNA polymerase-3 subunit delta